jgi:hypothetical protein
LKGLTIAVIAALAALGASTANANESQPLPSQETNDHSTGGGGGGGGGCTFPTWDQQPRIVIHTAQFLAGGGNSASEDKMVNAIEQVADEFSDTDAMSARITTVSTTSDPYYYGVWENDAQPTIHVRFSPQSAITDDNHGKAAAGLTTTHIVGCSIEEAHIEFPWPKDKDFNYETPWDVKGQRWFDTASTVNDHTWFRPSFLHELLHAFGLTHQTGVFTFMNHRSDAGFPWVNRPADNAARALPWELGVLRDAYGDSGSSYDVALANNWYGPPAPDDDAASQVALCPSGSAWDTGKDACVDPDHKSDRQLCGGDKLSVPFTLANYSTGKVHATVKLYFSTDPDWDANDLLAAGTFTKDVGAETALNPTGTFNAPDLGSGRYWAILRVEAVAADDASVVRHDWIPLRVPLGSEDADRMYTHAGLASQCGSLGSDLIPIGG